MGGGGDTCNNRLIKASETGRARGVRVTGIAPAASGSCVTKAQEPGDQRPLRLRPVLLPQGPNFCRTQDPQGPTVGDMCSRQRPSHPDTPRRRLWPWGRCGESRRLTFRTNAERPLERRGPGTRGGRLRVGMGVRSPAQPGAEDRGEACLPCLRTSSAQATHQLPPSPLLAHQLPPSPL